jgi:hypothetical protein
MTSSETDGLGASVAIYLAAILGVLALLALPVYLATRPQVYDIPPLAHADPLLEGPIIGERMPTTPALAVLQNKPIVDPKVVAALNAKVKEPEHHVSYNVSHRVVRRRAETPVAQLPDEPRQPQFFLFKLFGG